MQIVLDRSAVLSPQHAQKATSLSAGRTWLLQVVSGSDVIDDEPRHSRHRKPRRGRAGATNTYVRSMDWSMSACSASSFLNFATNSGLEKAAQDLLTTPWTDRQPYSHPGKFHSGLPVAVSCVTIMHRSFRVT